MIRHLHAGSILKAAVRLGIVGACLVLSAPLLAQQPRLRATLKGHTDEVLSLAFSPDGKTLISGSEDRSIKFWDVATGRNTSTLSDEARYHWESVAISPDGKVLASGGFFNKVKLWDVGTRKGTTLLDNRHQSPAPRVVFSPDGKTLASGGRCVRNMELWNVATGKHTATLKGYYSYDFSVLAMSFTPDSKTLASMGREGGIRLWDVATGKEKPATLKKADRERIEKLIGNLGSDKFLERDRATRELEAIGPMALDLLKQAANHEDAEIRRRAAGLVELLEERALTADGFYSAAFSPDCKTLATGKYDERGRIKLWDVATRKEQAALKGHTKFVRCLIFSPDGKTLASGSEDYTIMLWDVATGKKLVTLKGHTGEVLSLAFSADGKTMASGSNDRTIKLWDVAKAK